MSTYCTAADAYSWIPRGIAQRPARIASSVSTTLDTITIDDHGLADDDPITVRAESGGTLPSPLVAGTTYYAIVITPASFKLASAAGGSALDLTTAGSNVLVIAALPWDRWIEEESASVDCTLPAHVVPFASTPAIVRKYVAALVAQRAAIACGVSTPMLDAAIQDVIRPELAAWRKGVSIRGSSEPSQAQVPQMYTVTTTESTRVID